MNSLSKRIINARVGWTVGITVVAGCLLSGQASSATSHPALVKAPLLLEKSISIPGVPLALYSDVISVDVRGRRVFATPQAAGAVAVLDIDSGKVLKMLGGIGKLQGIFYFPDANRLFVVDGKSGEMKVFNGDTYALEKAIKLNVGADAVAYDPMKKLLYVGNAGEDAGVDHGEIAVVDPARLEVLAEIPVSSSELEGMAVDVQRQKLYINLVDEAAVAVIDLDSRRQVAKWKLPAGKHFPFQATVDAKRNRLYVVSRDDIEGFDVRGTLFVLDLSNGRTVASLPVGGWPDGVFVDARRDRVYVTTGVGRIDTFAVYPGDQYSRLEAVDTPLISKHGAFSPELDRLFVDTPHTGRAGAQVQIFKPE